MVSFGKSSDQYPHNDALTTYFRSMIMGCFCSTPHSYRKAPPFDPVALAAETPFTENEVDALYELFEKLSSSLHDDGLIGKDEFLLALFRYHGQRNLFADRIFDLFDVNRSGHIDFTQFVQSPMMYRYDMKDSFSGFLLYTHFLCILKNQIHVLIDALFLLSPTNIASTVVDLAALVQAPDEGCPTDGEIGCSGGVYLLSGGGAVAYIDLWSEIYVNENDGEWVAETMKIERRKGTDISKFKMEENQGTASMVWTVEVWRYGLEWMKEGWADGDGNRHRWKRGESVIRVNLKLNPSEIHSIGRCKYTTQVSTKTAIMASRASVAVAMKILLFVLYIAIIAAFVYAFVINVIKECYTWTIRAKPLNGNMVLLQGIKLDQDSSLFYFDGNFRKASRKDHITEGIPQFMLVNKATNEGDEVYSMNIQIIFEMINSLTPTGNEPASVPRNRLERSVDVTNTSRRLFWLHIKTVKPGKSV
ncbi:hypothetical protein LXL04_014239 [Taraxacum kok-saghyz]